MSNNIMLKEPLFLGVAFLNVKTMDKKAPLISVRINLQCDDIIYVNSVKGRMEVIGYEDPDTHLFQTEIDGIAQEHPYHTFRLKAIAFAKQELNVFLTRLQGLNDDEYKDSGYKPLSLLTNALHQCLIDRQEFYLDLQKQINVVVSRKLPRVNEYILYQDDVDVPYTCTTRLSYNNPKGKTLTEDEKALVESFLGVFLDEYNQFVLSWYLGAALLNIDLHDDRVSKLAIVSSSRGGSGKSSLINALSEALFTSNFCEIKDKFDAFFYNTNQFGISALSWKRLSVYSEAEFANNSNKSDGDKKHDFSGMNVSILKSLITEGYVSSEAKYSAVFMDRLHGFHMVLTNHPPIINKEDSAINRRILPIMIKPTSMTTKAKALDLWGQQTLNAYVQQHKELFAIYFTQKFLSDEYAFAEHVYDHKDYVDDIKDSQDEIVRYETANRVQLQTLRVESFFAVCKQVASDEQLDMMPFMSDIISVIQENAKDDIQGNIRYQDGVLYINSSKSFLLRYGKASAPIRQMLQDVYGMAQKKHSKRMFCIDCGAIDSIE